MKLYSHITKIKTGYAMRVTADIEGRVIITEGTFANKKAAKDWAKGHGAQAWNYI